MNKQKHILSFLIKGFLEDKLTKKRKKLVDRFSDSFRYEEEWNEDVFGNKSDLSLNIYSSITSNIKSREILKHKRKRILIQISFAASFFFLVGIFSLSFFNKQTEVLYTTVESTALMDSVVLKDGSIIYMSPHSSLTYPSDFNEKERNVSLLKGNAFFKVAKNPQKPFVINASGIKTMVLGTSFNISLLNNQYKLTVHTGKVNVSTDGESVNVLPFQMVTYMDEKFIKKDLSQNTLIDWFQKNIYLQEVALKEVIDVIECKFGVHFNNPRNLTLDNLVTFYISQDDSLVKIMKQLNFITDLKFEKNENEIIVFDN